MRHAKHSTEHRARPRGARHGFALGFIVVTVAVLALIAAAALPILYGAEQTARANATLDKLQEISAGLCCSAKSFRTTINRNAGAVSELVTVIKGNNASYLNSCQAQFTPAQAANWTTPNAPFVSFMIDSNGMKLPMGTLMDAISLRQVDDTVYLVLINIDTADLRVLDIVGDNGNGDTHGVIKWITGANPTTGGYAVDLGSNTC